MKTIHTVTIIKKLDNTIKSKITSYYSTQTKMVAAVKLAIFVDTHYMVDNELIIDTIAKDELTNQFNKDRQANTKFRYLSTFLNNGVYITIDTNTKTLY